MSVQTIWANVIARTVADAGITTVVVSPGSRSTPLTAALAADGRLALPTLIDERTAGFFALGLARASQRPVALLCTSGTAAAHYVPAIIEASEAGIPLVVITADRPPELWSCGAPQTIDQVKLYGGFVRAYLDLGAPESSALALRAVRRKIAQAVAVATGTEPGPVHLEVPLRKPLEPAAPSTDAEREIAEAARALVAAPLPWTTAPVLRADETGIAALAAILSSRRSGMIVAGPAALTQAGAREALWSLAARTGYVVCAEAGSQLRLAPRPAGAVACDAWDLVLAAPSLAEILAPSVILQIGSEPVAASWPPFLQRHRRAERWVVTARGWPDPDSSASGILRGDVADTLTRLDRRIANAADGDPAEHRTQKAAVAAGGSDDAWVAAWQRAESLAWDAIAAQLTGHDEPAVIAAAVAALPAGAAVVLGNSLPVRVIDQVCRGGGHDLAVVTQRGANGIDGLIAGAAGCAHAGRPTLLVIGDVSFAHDIGGLAAARQLPAPLVILVVDNGGGRIFDTLPVASAGLPAGSFERHWTTPPGVDPIAAAAAYGIPARIVRGADVAGQVAAALAGSGATVLHAPVAATSALAFRRAVISWIDAAIGRPAPSVLPAARVAEGARR